MDRILTVAVLATLVALMGLTPTVATATEPSPTTDVTFRAAPAGFVVPSVFVVNNEATWILDPAEDDTLDDAPGVAGCELAVEDHNGDDTVDGADALNEAEETGCIDGWSGRNNDACTDGDVFVAEVDGLEEAYPATFWIIHRNGQTANVGVCGMALESGDALTFVYE